jgi:hypothetical protein
MAVFFDGSLSGKHEGMHTGEVYPRRAGRAGIARIPRYQYQSIMESCRSATDPNTRAIVFRISKIAGLVPDLVSTWIAMTRRKGGCL